MNNIRCYEDAVSYIMAIPRFADKNDFYYMNSFYRFLNLEKEAAKVIHVAGTNGKGSTCAYLYSLNRAMGKNVGVFTSPHLVDVRERICINGQMISKEDFFDAFIYVYGQYEEFIKKDEYKDYHPTYFAWFFFVAAASFVKKNLDVIIWETGLGGRLDATNTLLRKDVCIITEIGLDHMEYLGDTVEAIAGEKAGIIRNGVPVVIADRENGATKVLESQASNCGAPLIKVRKSTIKMDADIHKGIDFSYISRYYRNAKFTLGALGLYQVENASLALNAMEIIYNKEELSLELLQKGLSDMNWSGRMEEIAPGIIFDGAHNVDGIEALLDSIRLDGCKGRRCILFSAVTDKQADVMLDMVNESGLFDKIAVAHMETGRAIATYRLKELVDNIVGSVVYEDVAEAFRALSQEKGVEDRLYVCGSLYLIGELKGLM